VFHEITHVEKAGGFSGDAVRAPTVGGTGQTVLTGTARTLDQIAANVGHEEGTLTRWYRVVAPAGAAANVHA
jgi:hypothetical protein